MKRLLILLLLFSALVGAQSILAQTDTPSPTPSPQPTFTPYPFDDMVGTLGIPTNIPALSLTPKPWNTPTRMSPGAAFNAPDPPDFPAPGIGENEVAHGFEAISEANVLRLGRYFAEVSVAFYGWLNTNYVNVLRALRILSLIFFLMSALYAIVRRFAPDLASARAQLYERAESLRQRRNSP